MHQLNMLKQVKFIINLLPENIIPVIMQSSDINYLQIKFNFAVFSSHLPFPFFFERQSF